MEGGLREGLRSVLAGGFGGSASARAAQSSINGGCAMGEEGDDEELEWPADCEHDATPLGCGVLQAFPALRIRGLLRRSVVFALTCAPLGFLCAWALMHIINRIRGCPTLYGQYMECVWNRGDSGAFLGLHAMIFNSWVSVLSLSGYLLEANLGSEDVQRMVRAQHPEDFEDVDDTRFSVARENRSGFLFVASYVA